jgi:hypothetical protein
MNYDKTSKNGQPITGGLAQAGAHFVRQLAVFSEFSSRPSGSGNPRLRQAAATLAATGDSTQGWASVC